MGLSHPPEAPFRVPHFWEDGVSASDKWPSVRLPRWGHLRGGDDLAQPQKRVRSIPQGYPHTHHGGNIRIMPDTRNHHATHRFLYKPGGNRGVPPKGFPSAGPREAPRVSPQRTPSGGIIRPQTFRRSHRGVFRFLGFCYTWILCPPPYSIVIPPRRKIWGPELQEWPGRFCYSRFPVLHLRLPQHRLART